LCKNFLGILVLGLLLSASCFADSKFDKDLKKISKNNGFVDNTGVVYSEEQISNKENTILIIFSHGSTGDQKIDKCLKGWAKSPSAILNLHDQKIKNFEVKVYRLCSGVRGCKQAEQGKMWKVHEKSGKLDLKLTDEEGAPLIQKQKQLRKQKIIKEKIDRFIEQGFKNIVLAGHSSAGWQSITLKSQFHKKIKGVIAFHSGGGGTINNRKDWPWWEDIRNHHISLIDLTNLNALIVTHDKDQYNVSEDYSFLSNINSVKFINLTRLDCKRKVTLGGYHGIALTKCFAEQEAIDKNIIQYLEGLF
jgi:hypothetical protein